MDIKALLNPTRVIEIQGSCPVCGETHHTDNGMTNLTLHAVDGVVMCRNCEASWEGKGLWALREHIRPYDVIQS